MKVEKGKEVEKKNYFRANYNYLGLIHLKILMCV